MRRALLALPLLFATPAYAQTRPETQVTKPAYPETRRVQVVEEQFGVRLKGDDVAQITTVGEAVDLIVAKAG